jgi:hypothetical protein
VPRLVAILGVTVARLHGLAMIGVVALLHGPIEAAAIGAMLHRPILPAAIRAILQDLIVTVLHDLVVTVLDDAALGLMATLRSAIVPGAHSAMLYDMVVTVLGDQATVSVMLRGAIVQAALGAMLDRMSVSFSCRAASRGVWLRMMRSRRDGAVATNVRLSPEIRKRRGSGRNVSRERLFGYRLRGRLIRRGGLRQRNRAHERERQAQPKEADTLHKIPPRIVPECQVAALVTRAPPRHPPHAGHVVAHRH